jgi:hypothetical protein
MHKYVRTIDVNLDTYAVSVVYKTESMDAWFIFVQNFIQIEYTKLCFLVMHDCNLYEIRLLSNRNWNRN